MFGWGFDTNGGCHDARVVGIGLDLQIGKFAVEGGGDWFEASEEVLIRFGSARSILYCRLAALCLIGEQVGMEWSS